MIITLRLARYGYKMYTNYLINSENIVMHNINNSIKEIKEPVIQKVVEQAPIVINTGAETGTNWWLWGTVIVIGVLAVGAIIIGVWSNANNIAETSEASLNLSK